MTADTPPDNLIVIGIDFGTTYSGIAWAYSGDPEIELVTSWEAELNNCSDVEKAPSQLHYGERGEPTTWGYSVPPKHNPLKWFKLLLLDEKDIPKRVLKSAQLREARRLQNKVNKDPVDIISCFLQSLWNHAVDSITRGLGDELLGKCKFHIVITLPAIWPPYAQQRMKQAVKASGMLAERTCGETTIRFISEPEAAALATLKDLSKRPTIKKGDALVVCDAGGGTVDLISYVVEDIEPFVVSECVGGDGDLCGGVFLDERFIDLIQEKVHGSTWDSVSDVEKKRFLNDFWEHGIKQQFRNQPKTWFVELPVGCQLAGRSASNKKLKKREAIQLTSEEIHSVFSPIINKITALVKKQAAAIRSKYSNPPKYIVLAGGFGRSPYLFEHLQREFRSETTVLQSRGSKPWTSICRGAVLQGLTRNNLAGGFQVKVESRIARASYGVSCIECFIEGTHDESKKYWDEDRQEYMVGSLMEWYLIKGEDMSDKEPVRMSFTELLTEGNTEMGETILTCTEGAPPTEDDTVKDLCTIKWTRAIPLESLPTFTNKLGKVYREISFDIEMTCEEGTVDFTIYHNDQRVAARNVEVDFA